eukprot:gene6245-4494_t
MGRASKDKRDIYYRKAKEEGYRARSAYKLLQINEAFPLFEHIEHGVVDLCAAPGSWSQVLSRVLREEQDQVNSRLLRQCMEENGQGAPSPQIDALPPPPPIVAVDLQEMAPIDGVTLLQGDITSEETAKEIIRLLSEAAVARQRALGCLTGSSCAPEGSSPSECRADLVVCDGAPDVTGLHELDEYLQHQLLLAALHITSHLLRDGGTFVTKVFRGPNTGFLVAKSEVFFKSVRILKPMSSRNASMECFMLCEGFHLPEGYQPSFSVSATNAPVSLADAEAPRQRRRTEMSSALEGSSHLTSECPDKQNAILGFLACGDLAGYDADMCYARRETDQQRSLPPVQPPLQAPETSLAFFVTVTTNLMLGIVVHARRLSSVIVLLPLYLILSIRNWECHIVFHMSSINAAEILRISSLLQPLLTSNKDRPLARQHIEKILTLDVEEDEIEAIQAKEVAVFQFMKLLLLDKDGERLIKLLQHDVRPLFSLLPKVKATKIMRTLFDAIVECRVPLDRQEMVCRESIQWAAKEKRTFLRHRLELRLVEMVFQRRHQNKPGATVGSPLTPSPTSQGPTSVPSTSALREAMHLVQNALRELRGLDDRGLLLEAHLLESQIYHASRNLPKARAALVGARTTASSIYCSPLSQAQIDLQSGLLHMEEKDYRTAFSYLFEAFEGFHALGDQAIPARQSLRYLVLSRIFSGTQEDVNALLSSSHILAYNGPELKALRAIAEAYFKSDTHMFNTILQQEEQRSAATSPSSVAEGSCSVLQDEVVLRQLTDMYDALMERHLLKLILPYHRVQIQYLADLLGQDRNDVELRISQLILDQKIHGIVDQELHCLCVFEDAAEEKARRKQQNRLVQRHMAAAAGGFPQRSAAAPKRKAGAEEESGGQGSSSATTGENAAGGSGSPNALVGAPRVETTTLYHDAHESLRAYDKLVTALFDKAGGKFDALVDAARQEREARKQTNHPKKDGGPEGDDKKESGSTAGGKEGQEKKAMDLYASCRLADSAGDDYSCKCLTVCVELDCVFYASHTETISNGSMHRFPFVSHSHAYLKDIHLAESQLRPHHKRTVTSTRLNTFSSGQGLFTHSFSGSQSIVVFSSETPIAMWNRRPSSSSRKGAATRNNKQSGSAPDCRHNSIGGYQHPYWHICRQFPSTYYNYEKYQITFTRDTSHYELLQKVGRGKYSEVFRGRQKRNGCICVLKILKPVAYRKIQREIMILKMMCGGPNVVRLLDVLKHPPTDTPVLVTEYVENATNLRKLLYSRRLTNFDMRYYLYEILRTLDFAHRHGVFHRDIKPHNIMIDHDHRVLRVIDWGLAEFYVHGEPLNCGVATRHYKGPELLLGYRHYDFSLDIWSLGCVLAGLLFRRDPFFEGDNNEDQLILLLELYGTEAAVNYVKKYGGRIPSSVQAQFDRLPTKPLSWYEYIRQSQWGPWCDPVAMDLLTNMLQFDHQYRYTAEECMNHPFFAPVVDVLKRSVDEQYPVASAGRGTSASPRNSPSLSPSYSTLGSSTLNSSSALNNSKMIGTSSNAMQHSPTELFLSEDVTGKSDIPHLHNQEQHEGRLSNIFFVDSKVELAVGEATVPQVHEAEAPAWRLAEVYKQLSSFKVSETASIEKALYNQITLIDRIRLYGVAFLRAPPFFPHTTHFFLSSPVFLTVERHLSDDYRRDTTYCQTDYISGVIPRRAELHKCACDFRSAPLLSLSLSLRFFLMRMRVLRLSCSAPSMSRCQRVFRSFRSTEGVWKGKNEPLPSPSPSPSPLAPPFRASPSSSKNSFQTFLRSKNELALAARDRHPFALGLPLTSGAEEGSGRMKEGEWRASMRRASAAHGLEMTQASTLNHSAQHLKRIVQRALEETKLLDSAGHPPLLLPSLDKAVSAQVDTTHHLLSSWTPERLQLALSGVKGNEDGKLCDVRILLRSLFHSLLLVDEQLDCIQFKIAAKKHLRKRNTVYAAGELGQRVDTWRQHSGVYTALSWLILPAVKVELAQLVTHSATASRRDSDSHRYIFLTVWRAALCTRRQWRGACSRSPACPLAPPLLLDEELAYWRRLESEVSGASDGCAEQVHAEKQRMLWSPSAEDWCIRWWLGAGSKESVPAFGPPMGWCRPPPSSTPPRTDDRLQLDHAARVLAALVHQSERHTCAVSNDCGAAFLKAFLRSLHHWFGESHRMDNKWSTGPVNRGEKHWIRAITLVCRAVTALPSSLGAHNHNNRQPAPGAPADTPLMELLLDLLLSAAPLLREQASSLDGETVSHLLYTFAMLGFSGEIPSLNANRTTNIYVVLAHRAGQLADSLTADEMQRVLSAVEQIPQACSSSAQTNVNTCGPEVDETLNFIHLTTTTIIIIIIAALLRGFLHGVLLETDRLRHHQGRRWSMDPSFIVSLTTLTKKSSLHHDVLESEHRRRVLYAHPCGQQSTGDDNDQLHSSSSSSGISGNALLMASDVRLSYAQGGTSLFICLSGPTTSKHESAYDKAEVVLRLQPRSGVLSIHPMLAVGAAPERRRFLEARHQALQETYAAVLLPMLQTSVEAVLCLEQFPRCVLVVDVLVLEEDGGLLPTVLNGVMCAMLEGGWPCRSCFAAVNLAALTSPSQALGSKRARIAEEETENGLCFVVDPTALEETLCGTPVETTKDTDQEIHAAAVAQAAAVASTTRGQLLQLQQECRTVAVGTYVFLYRPGAGSAATYPTLATNLESGPGAARARDMHQRSAFLSPMDTRQMEQMAAGAAHPVFEFFRKLNVSLED